MKAILRLWLMLFLAALTAPAVFGDEGMWLFNNPPKELLKKKYGFDVTENWLEHVQKSSVRFNNGGSGSFVSPDGLVMTNHHVALDILEKLSSEKKDYVADGFQAKSRDEELKADALELNVLMSIEDVTDRVKAAVKPDMKPAEAFAARRAVIAKIEKESLEKTKLRSDVVTLYQGGQFHLYRYKRYTDIRLVFAPEQQIAFFGGDPDNFAYPRYNLDVTFFRVYEDGKPAKIEHYLKWSAVGAKKDELVFVSGHPGKTNRLNTVAELEYLRDKGYPFLLQMLYRWEVMASVYSGDSAEHARKAKDFLFSIANSRKARKGGLGGLLDPALMAKKKQQEKALKEAVGKDPELKGALAAWDTVAKVQKLRTEIIGPYNMLEGGRGFNTTLFGYARTLVRAADEFAKPNEERLPEFAEAGKKSLELQLFSEQPIYPDFEIVKLADSLTFLAEVVGTKDPLVQKVLAGKSPQARAAELVLNTKVGDKKYREELYKNGVKGIKDPLLELAQLVDKKSRELRKQMEEQVMEPKNQAYDKIAKAKFAAEGASTYPDATFTLRLAFGEVKGYEENGKHVPFETVFTGLYERAKSHNYKEPFDLPKRWVEGKDKLNLKTPFNFVCTADIIGGNSGSPVINKKGEVVGLIFDGNIQSLVLDFIYTDEQARAVSVHSEGILEALRAIYNADDLVSEIVGSKSAAK